MTIIYEDENGIVQEPVLTVVEAMKRLYDVQRTSGGYVYGVYVQENKTFYTTCYNENLLGMTKEKIIENKTSVVRKLGFEIENVEIYEH